MAYSNEYPARIGSLLASLEIPSDLIAARALPLQPEAEDLVVAEIGDAGKEYKLIPAAAIAWRSLRAAALADGITILIVSAFRGAERQAEIVRDKLARGMSMEEILAVNAPPGYSEHHTGRAVDVTTDGVKPLDLEFEQTPAFRWLSERAGSFSFYLSFAKGNQYGYTFEPWHWCYGKDVL